MTKKTTRVLSLVMAVALVVTMMAGVMTASAASYKDIKNDHWAKSYIDYLSEKSIFQGDNNGKFNPDKAITTAELMAVINRTFGLSATTTISYADVAYGSWYYSDVAKAAAQGYIMSDGAYVYPNQALTREKAVAMIARYLGLETATSANIRFADASQINSKYAGYVNAAVTAGIINGYTENGGTYFKPQKALERDEVAKIIYTMLGGNIIRENLSNKTANGGCITRGNISINNSYLTGDVYVTEGASTGTVTISNSTIGTLIVRGSASISLSNSTVAELVIDCSSGAASVYASGSTVVRSTQVKSGAALSDSTSKGGSFASVTAMAPAGKLSLAGVFSTVNVTAPNCTIDIPGESSSVASLTVGTAASNTTVTGKGAVSAITVQASGCTVQQRPATYTIGNGLYATFGGQRYSGTGAMSATNTGFSNGYPYVNGAVTNGTLSLSVTAKTAEAGTLYLVVYPDAYGTLSAANIQSYAYYNYSGTVGKYESMSANSQKTIDMTVSGVTNAASYEVAAIFVPAGGTTATYLPVYADAYGSAYMTAIGTGSTGSSLVNVPKIEKTGTLSLMMNGVMYVKSPYYGTVTQLSSSNASSYVQVLNANGNPVSTSDYYVTASNFSGNGQTYINVYLNPGKTWPDGAVIYITGLCDASGNAYGNIRETFVEGVASGAPSVSCYSNTYSHDSGDTIANGSTVYVTSGSTIYVSVYVPAYTYLYKSVNGGTATAVNSSYSSSAHYETVAVSVGSTVSFYTMSTSYAKSATTTFSVVSTGSGSFGVYANNTSYASGSTIYISKNSTIEVKVPVGAGNTLYYRIDGGNEYHLTTNSSSGSTNYSINLPDGTYTFYQRNASGTSTYSWCTITIEDGTTSWVNGPTVTYSDGTAIPDNIVPLNYVTDEVTLKIIVPAGSKLYRNNTLIKDNTNGYETTVYDYNLTGGTYTYHTTKNGASSGSVTIYVRDYVSGDATITASASSAKYGSASTIRVSIDLPNVSGVTWALAIEKDGHQIKVIYPTSSQTMGLDDWLGQAGMIGGGDSVEPGHYRFTLTGTKYGWPTEYASSGTITIYN